MNTKQREALQALADVMKKHEIKISAIHNKIFFGDENSETTEEISDCGWMDSTTINELLQEQE